ncbi:MAG: DHH family phosphoesterase [Peptoniphilaceae bacterium]|nr:DHH family phosphoesterase [Peptoniphilaceae bacterium]MDY6018198.1 DHH family phosphoesterase [Anaerococcus sp.]
MQEKNRLLKNENYVLILSLPILISVILLFYKLYLGILGLALTVGLYFYLKEIEEKNKNLLQAYVDGVSYSFDSISKNIIFEMPFPILILEKDKRIKWHNSKFRALFEDDSIVGKNVGNFIPEFKNQEFNDQIKQPLKINIGDETYEFYFSYVEDDKGDLIFLYGISNTYDESIKKLFKDRLLVSMLIYFDNYDDVKNITEAARKTGLMGKVDRTIIQYFQEHNAIIVRYENDKYIAILNYKDYRAIYDSKFSILDKVRGIEGKNAINPTLSIGVGYAGSTPDEVYEDSKMAIDIALSRGGDQAVIKLEDNYEYFGGKSKATEKISKVKSRVISHALRRLIENSSDIYVMGHNNPDMDSFGSALGVYECAKFIGKDVHFVLEAVTKPIENIYKRTVNSLDGFKDDVITENQALERISPQSLIIVTDNYRKNSTEAPSLLDKTDQIVIIDHHRRGKDYIKNATISYIEPYASSASELVTEIMNYFDESFKARTPVAEGLLAGITVDTKNFVYQTGVRTFEAASILKRWGADSIIIKTMFKDDFEIVRYKSEVISDAIVFDNVVAIGHFNRDIDGSTLIASQAADDLLNINGVKASFVLTRSNDRIHISGRSLGDISVQLILERIGGGGHLTSAATQLDMSMEDAEDMLKKAIKEYFMEEKENESNIN